MTSKSETAFQLAQTSHRPPVDYDRPPTYAKMIAEKDVFVPMRDGVKICVDIYRPDTTEKLPALLAIAIHNKDLQGPEMAETRPRSRPGRRCGPAPAEAGDTRFLVSRGYVHVIGQSARHRQSRKAAARAPWTATT